MYKLPNINLKSLKGFIINNFKSRIFWSGILIVFIGLMIGFFIEITLMNYFPKQVSSFLEYFQTNKTVVSQDANNEPTSINEYVSKFEYEQAIINVAKNVSPSVVSIVISKNVPVYEQEFINPFGEDSPFDFQIPQYVQKGTKLQEVGAGSGFIVSEDGLILTNKHVVSDKQAKYTVYTNEGDKYSAKVMALDPMQDLAVIKIENSENKFKPVLLGDSSMIKIGQTAIAIGNALGQLSNTVSVGVVSGLQRTISASDQLGTISETLEGIIQTDAAINSGNSGGPLVNLNGEVIGINTAMAQGAQNIGFAIPINYVKRDIEQVIKTNKIVYPFLGVRYVLIDEDVKKEYKLPVDYGAYILSGNKGESAIISDSPAYKAGIKEKDIILSINEEKITKNNSMSQIIQKYNVGDKIIVHILRKDQEKDIEVILSEKSL